MQQQLTPPNGLGYQGQQPQQYLVEANLQLPLRPADWKKLTRTTQIAILDELQLLNK